MVGIKGHWDKRKAREYEGREKKEGRDIRKVGKK